MDRLRSLPDEVIGHVLSFLPTKNFVQTSILAKRWRFLWTRLPVLGFTVHDDSKTINHFHNTIDQEFNSWINSTIFTRNVRNIVIRLNYQLTLPRCLFTSNTLVDLCIIDTGDIRMEGTVYNFPALKKLQLVNVGYDSETSLAHLISGCPVLEELIIDRIMLNISDPCLLKLNGSLDENKVRGKLYDKPAALRYLRIRASEIPRIWSGHSLHSLIEADIDLSEAQYSLLYVVRDFLPYLSNVKRLTLSSRRIEAPGYWFFPEHFNFHCLTELNLRADWSFVPLFLLHAKNLRVLTIHRMVDHSTQCWKERLFFLSPSHFYSSEYMINHLETLNLFDFEWSTNQEFEMVKIILGSAKVLKMMEIIYTAPHFEESDWNEKVEALNRLALFQMQSATCSVRLRSLT